MADLESSKPLYESSVKLCAAIKKHKCLHDRHSYHKYPPPECEAAWQLVAKECNETIEFCKNRWKTLRRCFFEGIKRRGNKYYLHEHLKFLQEDTKKTKRNHEASLNDETNSTLKKNYDDSFSLQGSEMDSINICDDDEDFKSVSSHTTSENESADVMKKTNQTAVFIIDEIEDNAGEADKGLVEERRLNYKRSCKRDLDPNLINELTTEEPEEKRSRKIPTEKSKTLTNESEKHILATQLNNNHLKVRMDKFKINLAQKRIETMKRKMIDGITHTDTKQSRDFATQYEINSPDLDDIFMQSIKPQLQQMNARQKMNFKRKVYESLLEVFDDASDFPNITETLQLPHKQAPRVINTTVGELRLMRELVSLVQAAKSTPEIVNANEKIKTPLSVQTKSPLKLPSAVADNRFKAQMSPLSLSPSLDDDDIQFPIDNIDDEDDAPLPRSWDEIKAKSTEPTKTTAEDNVMGLPRRMLQKVVRVAGSSSSTIVTRDGDKKRIYRIYPKLINPNENRSLPTKNDNNVGTLFLPPSKKSLDTKNNNNVGTFIVASKNPKDTATSSIKINNTTPNVSIRSFNNKPTNNSNESINSANKSNYLASSNNSNYATNNQTIFKNVHPANRILSATTGLFTMASSPKPITPTYVQKLSNVPSVGLTTTTAATKQLPAKLTVSPMLPPTSNITPKRPHTVRLEPQRRYSICGHVSAEKLNATSNTATSASKSLTSTNNVNTQTKTSGSQIQISQPITLNTKTVNAQTPSSTQNISSTTTKTLTPSKDVEDVKIQVKPLETPDNPVAIIEPFAATTSTKSEEIPILETAGTVEADILDPLFVKPPEIKSEPIDE